MNGMKEKMAWKLKKNKEIERKSYFGPLYLSTHEIWKKKIPNVILRVSVSYSSKYRLCTSNFTKTVSIWIWSNTLFWFMSENMSYTPHAFNLTFLKNHLEFGTEIFRAIFLNIKAHMREVSSKSEMVTFLKIGSL